MTGGEPLQAILIAGPTASGKSEIALALAERMGGVVVNADSMQVYGDLRILTARPSPEDEARAPHALYGHVDAGVNYSAGRWIADVAALLPRLAAEGQTPIFCGGTGLYLKALTQGLSDMPAVPEAVRARVRQEAGGVPAAALHARLAARDPLTAARLRPTDPQRILRALEVFEATGQPLAAFQSAPGKPLLAGRWAAVFLAPDRALLRQRIDRRFEGMMEAGALEEVRRLAARRLDPALPAMRAHGVPGLIDHIEGRKGLEDAIARGQGDTRRYAKRQFTWARHQLPDFQWVAPEAALGHLERVMAG